LQGLFAEIIETAEGRTTDTPGAARGAGSGMSPGRTRIAAIPRLMRLKKIERKQNQTAAYAIAIAGLPS